MIVIVNHSIKMDGNSCSIYNYLFQLFITRKYDNYEVVIYGDSKAFAFYKNKFEQSFFCSNVKISFISKSYIGLKRLNDYCNVKTCLLGEDEYLYISHDLRLVTFSVSNIYKGVLIARDMYDVCLYTRKGALTGLIGLSLPDAYVTQLLRKSIKTAFNLVRYELGFLYQVPVDDSFLLAVDEKERLLRVSFQNYRSFLNDFVFRNKRISDQTKEYINARVAYIDEFDSMIRVYEGDTNKSDVYFYYAFYLYLICQNLYDSKKYSLCVSTSIRILETYLTGYLIGASRAKPDGSRIKLHRYNHKKCNYEWVGAGGFGNVWEIFVDEFPLSLDASLISKVDKVKDLRNKSIYGHGYNPLTASSAQLSMETVMTIISKIEKDASGKPVFEKMKCKWVCFNKSIQKEILVDTFAIS